jgi:hypothetical protein
MKFNTIAIGFSLVSGLAAAGCGNGVASDPLAATWTNASCFGSSSKPADVASCSVELTFTNDLKIELRADEISLSATATNPGCTTTRIVQGQKWSTDHAADTFTVTGTGAATMQRSSCVNKSDDQPAVATTDIAIPLGDTTYAISGSTLTVSTGGLKGTYTR